MSKVMVYNFATEQYEQANEAEAQEWVGLIESVNADCSAQHRVRWTLRLQAFFKSLFSWASRQ
jgi:hypothetical protein